MATLVVILGPTGVGKTDLSLDVARHLGSPILSADSRQLYMDLPIGTAAPTPEQRAAVRHYMVGTLGLEDYYSASRFEEEALSLLGRIHQRVPVAVMAGGSMLYIDAVCRGIDEMPAISQEVRDKVWQDYHEQGLPALLRELSERDPDFYGEIDRMNHKRVLHAIEICRQSGLPYSYFRKNAPKERPFHILKIGLIRARQELYDRINRRVDQMIRDGLVEEARRVYPYRQLNSLNTVGYKELFKYLDGEWTLGQAVAKIKGNTREYARKQITWFKRDHEIHWFHPGRKAEILALIDSLPDRARNLSDT